MRHRHAPRGMTARVALGSGLAWVLGASPVSADAPLRTDNADVPERGNCKVESWYEGTSSTGAWVIAPTCTPINSVELGVGYARTRDADGVRGNNIGLQAKVAIVPHAEDSWFALATTFSIARDTGEPHGRSAFQIAAINVPASFYLLDERLRVHLNAGVLWQYQESTLATYGAATEYDLGPITCLAEVYRWAVGRPRYNLGARYNVGESLSFYASAGRRFGGNPDGWLWTVGLRLESDTFLK